MRRDGALQRKRSGQGPRDYRVVLEGGTLRDCGLLIYSGDADRNNRKGVSDLLRENLEEEQDADQSLASLQEDLLDDEDSQDEVSDEEMEEDLEDEIAQDRRV
jgi:hypothetical protein